MFGLLRVSACRRIFNLSTPQIARHTPVHSEEAVCVFLTLKSWCDSHSHHQGDREQQKQKRCASNLSWIICSNSHAALCLIKPIHHDLLIITITPKNQPPATITLNNQTTDHHYSQQQIPYHHYSQWLITDHEKWWNLVSNKQLEFHCVCTLHIGHRINKPNCFSSFIQFIQNHWSIWSTHLLYF